MSHRSRGSQVSWLWVTKYDLLPLLLVIFRFSELLIYYMYCWENPSYASSEHRCRPSYN